jgi:hypothetical protein
MRKVKGGLMSLIHVERHVFFSKICGGFKVLNMSFNIFMKIENISLFVAIICPNDNFLTGYNREEPHFDPPLKGEEG